MRRPGTRAARRDARGAVTAETVVVLPVLLAVTWGLVWLVSLAATQARVVDAAREGARALARDEPRGVAVALARKVAPAGSDVSVRNEADLVAVTVRASVAGPGGLFRFVPGVVVDAEAVAAREPR